MMFVGITIRYKKFGSPLFDDKYIISLSFVKIASNMG